MSKEWAPHPKCGEQFEFNNNTTTPLASVQRVEKELESGLIKGIGSVLAKRIV
ncbi:MAG: exodeoxyribonuclease V alpha [Desulfovibrionaceae bacterium]|nr:MAG: exodeoxyribonuclease V alpha [Desulfovibrionaceae bacterium]